MEQFIHKPMILCLCVIVLVGALGWTPRVEATTVGPFTADQFNLFSLGNLFDESRIQDFRNGLLEDREDRNVIGKIDFMAGVSFWVGDGTVHRPFTHSQQGMVFIAPETIPVRSSATNAANTFPGLPHEPPEAGNPSTNAIAAGFDLPARVTSLDEGGTWRGLSTRLGTLFLLWDVNYFEDPGNTDRYTNWDGRGFWSKFFGKSNGTQIWPENSTSSQGNMILFGAGVTGVLAWRMKKAQA